MFSEQTYTLQNIPITIDSANVAGRVTKHLCDRACNVNDFTLQACEGKEEKEERCEHDAVLRRFSFDVTSSTSLLPATCYLRCCRY